MADPLDAYNRELQRRSGPFGLAPAQTRIGAAAQAPLSLMEGLGGIADYLIDAPQKMGEATLDYLTGPSQFVRDVQSGKISESELPLGVDLVDIFGETDPTLGAPDFLPDDYAPGEIFSYDPTGKGLTKGMPETRVEREAREAKEGLDAEIQAALDAQFDTVAAQKKKDAQRAEDFRAKEAKIAEGQGGLQSMTVADSKNATEQMFAAAMDDFIKDARGTGPDVKGPKSLDDYKKEFADATGIKLGKIDKGAALMAAGAVLMNNKAGGKGFSGMLSALGEASEAALPKLEAARAQSRQEAVAAGKYALEMRAADTAKAEAAREKAMERSNYFVVPRSDDVKGFLAGIGEGRGRLESLSKYELNKLQNNPEFTDKFDVLPAATWATVVEEAMKTPEAKELYLTSAKEVPLFEGAESDLFKIRVYDPDPNKNPNGQPVIAGNGQDQYEALARMARDTAKAKDQFVELGVLNQGTSIYRYTVDSLNSLGSAFGLQFGSDVPETQRMKMILEKMQAKNAPAILGEAGKTISDADRARVAAIVGTITPTTDPRELQAKFEGLFNDIILGAESDIRQGLNTLDRYTGRSIGGSLSGGDLSEEEQNELKIGLEALGIE